MSSSCRKCITLTFKIECTHANRSLHITCYFDGHSMFLPIFHHFQDIQCGNVHDPDLDLQNGPGSNINIPNESQYMTCYILMAVVIFFVSLTIFKIFIVEMCMTLTFKMGQGRMYTFQQMLIHDLLFDGNSIFLPIYHHFQDIHCEKCMTLTQSFKMGQGKM